MHLLAPTMESVISATRLMLILRQRSMITHCSMSFVYVVTAELAGQTAAEAVQLNLEYKPAPPFNAGCPETASPEVLAVVRSRLAKSLVERKAIIAAIN
jgi:hypothetical protein